jgi:hypothetical protein
MTMTTFPIDPALQAELAALNAAVDAAVKARTEWMDAHMEAVSSVKVGDELYHRDTGRMVGVVTRLYRYHGDQKDWRYDTSMSVEAEYLMTGMPNCYDNTSRQPYEIGTKEDALARAESMARRLSV